MLEHAAVDFEIAARILSDPNERRGRVKRTLVRTQQVKPAVLHHGFPPERIPMRHVSIFLAAALPALVQAAPYSHTLNGDRFVQLMRKPEPLSSYDYMQREKAYSYVDGVRDAAEGRVWCDAYRVKTPDLAYDLSDEIAKLPETERKKNAAVLILEQLQKRFPCGDGRKQ
jgi:hypothetical protein